jgi:hypothetical protein
MEKNMELSSVIKISNFSMVGEKQIKNPITIKP